MCGIVGISKRVDGAAFEAYDGLLSLQHRGQDSAGIVSFDGAHFFERKGNGLVKDVFKQKHMEYLHGKMALGHVRYPTAGSSSIQEAQPFFVNAPFGIYLVHNGNLTNVETLREIMQAKYRRHLKTTSDSEILLNVLADHIYKVCKEDPEKNPQEVVFEAAAETMDEISGSYSVITMIDQIGLFAFRDRAGIRPLVLGKKSTTLGNAWMFASEDVAIKSLGYEVVRDVKPGEAILITPDGKLISKICVPGKISPCIFEYVYLARPDSMLDGISVYKAQLRMGTLLADQVEKANLEIDSIIPVPDSARPVALEMAEKLGIKYREGLIKNRYVGRTFIMPGNKMRKKSIRQKLSLVELEFKGKNVLLVDDSIVRGNTMKLIVALCRDAGANKVYVASAAPPLINPCVYGVDMPTRKELVAAGLSHEEIKNLLNVDALFYQKIEDLVNCVQFKTADVKNFCTGCFDGKYVTPEVTEEYLQQVEFSGRGIKKEEVEELPLISV